jgi:hypothetical protein
MSSTVAVIKALALVAVPIFCGVVVFVIVAPPETPGVYVETQRGIYSVATYSVHPEFSFSHVSLRTALAADGAVLSFFIVGPPSFAIVSSAASATMYFFAINDADPKFRSEYVPVSATIHKINPRAYRVTSEQLGTSGPAIAKFRLHLDSLRMLEPGPSLELLVGLVLQDPTDGTRRMYSVRLGPL